MTRTRPASVLHDQRMRFRVGAVEGYRINLPTMVQARANRPPGITYTVYDSVTGADIRNFAIEDVSRRLSRIERRNVARGRAFLLAEQLEADHA